MRPVVFCLLERENQRCYGEIKKSMSHAIVRRLGGGVSVLSRLFLCALLHREAYTPVSFVLLDREAPTQ